jgi:hypothetical protein
MRGVVLAELVDYIDSTYGLEVLDHVLSSSDLSTGGAYARTGRYPHSEFNVIVSRLGKVISESPAKLARDYGRHLFRRLMLLYPEALGAGTALDFLLKLDTMVHSWVVRLYPDAEVPRFTYPPCADGELRVVYESKRGMADFAEGLIEGCLILFREKLEIRRRDLGADGCRVEFHLFPPAESSEGALS